MATASEATGLGTADHTSSRTNQGPLLFRVFLTSVLTCDFLFSLSRFETNQLIISQTWILGFFEIQ
jgi:hypothetical protein